VTSPGFYGQCVAGGGSDDTPTPGEDDYNPTGLKHYCPIDVDLIKNGNVQYNGNGWTMTGPGDVYGKTSYNLLGGCECAWLTRSMLI